MSKYKYIVSSSVLISLLLCNLQVVSAENDTETIDAEPTVTEVHDSESETNEVEEEVDEQEVHNNVENEATSTNEETPSTTSNETTDEITDETPEQTPSTTAITKENINTPSSEPIKSVQSATIKSAEDYINEYAEAYFVSDLWSISQQFKEAYPEHPKLLEVINDAAINNLEEGLRNQRNGNFANASIYYNRVLDEPLVYASNHTLASIYLSYANNNVKMKTANEYYAEYQAGYFVTDLWLLAQEFKAVYPNDSRISSVINDAASKNFAEAQRVHRQEKFELATIYYNRVLGEEYVNETMKNLASSLSALADTNTTFRYADEFYTEYTDAYYVSDKWRIAQEFKNAYPADSRVATVINDAAAENIKEGQHAHRRGDFDLAIIYYNRVLSEGLISTPVREQGNNLVELANSKTLFKYANDFYNDYLDAYYVSDKWQIAQDFVALYPSDQRVLEVLNDAAAENIKEGQRNHRNSRYDVALIYYNRVLDAPLVANHIHNVAHSFAVQATNKTPLKMADDYFKEYNKAYYVSDKWRIAQEFKVAYPDDFRVVEAINDAAEKNIDEGRRAHNAKNYELALIYYNRVLGEEFVEGATQKRVQRYIEFAEGKTQIKSVGSFNKEFDKAYFVSQQWVVAKEFKTLYPDNEDALEAMNIAANGNLKEGRTAQRKGDKERAQIYYNRVLNEGLVDERLRYLASVFLNQTSESHTPVVYIDVGHGGNDPGASHFGVREKDLNLSVSKLLKTELQNRGYIVIMSREIDKFIELSDRPYEANDLEVDAFISVHHNSMGGSGVAKGLETFIFHRVASGFGQETNHNNFNLDQPRINESLLLANHIHSNLVQSTGMYNRGVKGNNFNVLRNSYAPAALLELGFMDNRSELSFVNNKSFQQRAAKAVANGVDTYFKGIN